MDMGWAQRRWVQVEHANTIRQEERAEAGRRREEDRAGSREASSSRRRREGVAGGGRKYINHIEVSASLDRGDDPHRGELPPFLTP